MSGFGSARLRLGLAQLDSKLGDLEENASRHAWWIERAAQAGVELLLFPELSLTGYRLLHLTARVAMELKSSLVLKRLGQIAPEMAVVVGCVEEDERGALYNAAVVLHEEKIAHIHRKLYLPTYGIFQEGRFFAQGNRLQLFRFREHTLGLLICEDFWHAEPAARLVRAGAKLVAVISASPGRIGSGEMPASQEAWESLTRAAALLNTAYVAYVGRVGWEEGTFYTGGSHVVRPGGELIVRGPYLEEELLVVEVDLREVDRLRWRLPILEAERSDIEGPE